MSTISGRKAGSSPAAAYAFFANPKARPTDILLPHQQRTLERMAAYPFVLAIQDTLFLNYTHHLTIGRSGGGASGCAKGRVIGQNGRTDRLRPEGGAQAVERCAKIE